MARSCLTIILAAGEGTRMRSQKPKVLHEVAGLAMVSHVARAARGAGEGDLAVVTGPDAEAIRGEIAGHAPEARYYEQVDRLGTAHAVLAAREAIAQGHDDVLVLFADTPLLRAETLDRIRAELAKGAEIAVLGFRASDPTGYGRLIERDGELLAIREHNDASEQERCITFCNGGIMGFAGRDALALLDAIGNDNAKSEFYLTDIVEIARKRGLKAVALEAAEEEVLGINTRVELARAEAVWQSRRRQEVMLGGVTMHAPETVMLHHDTVIGTDSVIEPNVVFGPGVALAGGVHVRAFSHLEGCRIEAGVTIGPFARLRPGTDMGQGSRVGNFCELKNAQVEAGAKINHLSYVGDARVGAGANIGAGTITCNYDGVNKYRTDIGAGAFIGSNSALVAPVSIGDDAYVASGSVITEDVPADALAVARGRQANKPGRAAAIRARAKALKQAR
ncbi:MAG: bifunctional UDP-N-acetylglucosamine diphosphorylase/glucosamine-1-phosphate N-acetyltransferase GlmU [Pseudomonadota bacterium]|nr:bifunctional UDP-N-acetylglucosamine diphosphorylase/glucosamine-1-phosphate N-acetyltransferase GlmU [Pseudomonadota bacterium]